MVSSRSSRVWSVQYCPRIPRPVAGSIFGGGLQFSLSCKPRLVECFCGGFCGRCVASADARIEGAKIASFKSFFRLSGVVSNVSALLCRLVITHTLVFLVVGIPARLHRRLHRSTRRPGPALCRSGFQTDAEFQNFKI
jgi:hypothetical protein